MAISHSTELQSFSVVCDNCFVEMTTSTYIRCYECILDLCLFCFLHQTETPVHSRYHRYRVISRMDVKIYDEGWSLLEEVLFIGGLETCGIGNWAEVSRYVGKNKDVEEHFCRLFGVERDLEASNVVEARSSNPYRGMVSSYMPYRKDFDIEYMNDQETLLKDIEYEDDGLKKKFVNVALKSYMNTIKYRNRRKYVIFDRNLMAMELLRNNDEKAGAGFVGDIKCIVPYLTKSDFNTFFSGLYIENKLLMLLRKCVETMHDRIDVKRLVDPDHLLLENERRIRDVCRMSSTVYLELKKEAVSYFVKRKEFTKHRLKMLLGLHDKRVDILYDFFYVQGWIRTYIEKQD